MTKVMVVYGVIAYGIGLLVGAAFVPWTLGILLGLISAVLKLKAMEINFQKAVHMPENQAKNYIQKHYMIRYFLTGGLLVVAVLSPHISILGVFIGLLSMKIGAYSELYQKRSFSNKS